MRERSCAMVVVGNEILSGKVQDTNAYFAARELRRIGVTLKRITVVPDEYQPIADEVAECARTHDFVITSGGVGPTHDDITIEAIARAFGRKMVIDPELERLVRLHFTERVETGMKMAEIPEGAVLNAAGDLRFPTVQIENVYILPGIPQIFERKLAGLIERFATDPYFIRIIYSSAGEGVITEYLNACVKDFPDLMLGSYPRIGDPEYRVKLTLESKERDYLERAFNRLIELLPRDVVVRTE
ncbi:MAG TPA: competence/damage-inducible protein A [Candidatus Binataceae bacterium]|jgi:molybdenum cofactor synthesis domain-containing protein|nr:competence/damage-inducible protein A [Candidatus Binataceae bacterium]